VIPPTELSIQLLEYKCKYQI